MAKKEPNLQLDGYVPSEYREFAIYCEVVSFSINSLRSRLNLFLRLSWFAFGAEGHLCTELKVLLKIECHLDSDNQ